MLLLVPCSGRFGGPLDREMQFFEKVKARLRNRELYQDFLKCLNLYAQEIISRQELLNLAHVGSPQGSSATAGSHSSAPMAAIAICNIEAGHHACFVFLAAPAENLACKTTGTSFDLTCSLLLLSLVKPFRHPKSNAAMLWLTMPHSPCCWQANTTS
jgi:hypothetical protein